MADPNDNSKGKRPVLTNPYVGLRPFDIDESLLFFGRNDQILELLQKLHLHRFVAVVGSSGCGKSSLLRAGVIPYLKAGYLIQNSDHWCISIMRPGQSPLYNLVEALLSQLDQEFNKDDIPDVLSRIREEGSAAVTDLLLQYKKDLNQNFFVLVDQFEELFRFAMDQGNTAKKDEAIDFVHILLELTQQKVIPLYVVITMRSDFLGDCTQFYGLPEIMNNSLFLVPKLNRMQLKMAITGPATLYGGSLNPVLTSHLLNVVGNVKDELPLLQHALMRIWDHETTLDRSGEMDMDDFEGIGGIEKALSMHADEALAGMGPEDLGIAKTIFQALTTTDEHGRRTRRPVLLSDLEALAGADKEKLLHIINRFIEGKRSFLIINNIANTGDKVIDISHESLIRQWDQLNKWMDEEADSAANYIRLLEASVLHKQHKKDLLTGSELQIALDWQQKFMPVAVWANRYKEGFGEAIAYLDNSKEQWIEDERLEKERLLKEVASKKRLRYLMVGMVIMLVVVGFALYAYYTANEIANLNELRIAKANKEKEDALQQLKLLEGAKDSIQNIIAEVPNTDANTKTRLENVSQQVGGLITTTKNKLESTTIQINAEKEPSEANQRRMELQQKIDQDAGNPRVIKESVSSLEVANIGKMSPQELVNTFYFLNRTTKEAWTSSMVDYTYRTLRALEAAIRSGKVRIGPQAIEEMKKFKEYLVSIERGSQMQLKK